LRKVFLDDLPKHKNRISWIKSAEEKRKIKFIYDDITGKFEILNYNLKEKKLIILYDNKEYKIYPGHLAECKISIILGIITKEYKYNIGDIIETDLRKIKIIDCIRIKKDKWTTKGYRYKCLICGNIDEITEYHLNKNGNCSVCANVKVKIGFNNIATTRPDLLEIMQNHEDAYKYNKFTATVSGTYLISCFITFEYYDVLLSSQTRGLAIYKNNASFRSVLKDAELKNSENTNVLITELIILNATDYIEMYAYEYGKSNLDILSNNSYLSIIKITSIAPTLKGKGL
jgi:hypothetical protein